MLSNKGILPMLWQKHEGHPNLLPAFFDDGSELPPGWVSKPLHSREGANIDMRLPDGTRVQSDGPYRGPCIRQAFQPLARFDGRSALLGSWVIGDRACGLGIIGRCSRVIGEPDTSSPSPAAQPSVLPRPGSDQDLPLRGIRRTHESPEPLAPP